MAKNKYKLRAWVMFIAAVLNIFLTIYLIRVFGPIGAATSTTISILISNGLVLNWMYLKILKLDIVMFFRNVAPIWLAAVLTLPLLYLFEYSSIIQNLYIRFIVNGCIFLFLFVVLQLFIAVNQDEKRIILSLLKLNKNK